MQIQRSKSCVTLGHFGVPITCAHSLREYTAANLLEKVKNLLRFDDSHQVKTENQKSSEPHQKDTEMIPEVRWRLSARGKPSTIVYRAGDSSSRLPTRAQHRSEHLKTNVHREQT